MPGTTSMMNLKKSAFLQQFSLDFRKCLELEIGFINYHLCAEMSFRKVENDFRNEFFAVLHYSKLLYFNMVRETL